MADFDPLTIPAVMPAKVPVAKQDGTPTTHWVKWMEGLQAWMKANVANTNTRLNLISEEVGDAYAAIEEEAETRATADTAIAATVTTLTATVGSNTAAIATEASTRATADSALSTSITTVDAKANSATASGQVFIAAKAAPAGSSAAYGWFLTAGTAFAGMEAVALSGGGSAIGFTANKFYFTDSGTAQQVWTYSGGVFTFNVPIVIQSGTSGARKVSTGENDKVYDASNVLRVAIGINI